ncbi:MAG: hypothetical protein AAGG68_08145 [Bacteroidota bacterium]
MKIRLTFALITLLFFACQPTSIEKERRIEYSYWVSDIAFDARTDKSNFQLCDSTQVIHRRSALSYEGGKQMVKKNALEQFEFQSEFETAKARFQGQDSGYTRNVWGINTSLTEVEKVLGNLK